MFGLDVGVCCGVVVGTFIYWLLFVRIGGVVVGGVVGMMVVGVVG